MKKLFSLVALAVFTAGSALACNPWVSPTDTACQGMGMAVSLTAPAWAPQYTAVTPTTGAVSGSIAFNTNGVPCILSATTWVKLTSPAAACNFLPASAL